jgi:hypothetical protein
MLHILFIIDIWLFLDSQIPKITARSIDAGARIAAGVDPCGEEGETAVIHKCSRANPTNGNGRK